MYTKATMIFTILEM